MRSLFLLLLFYCGCGNATRVIVPETDGEARLADGTPFAGARVIACSYEFQSPDAPRSDGCYVQLETTTDAGGLFHFDEAVEEQLVLVEGLYLGTLFVVCDAATGMGLWITAGAGPAPGTIALGDRVAAPDLGVTDFTSLEALAARACASPAP